MNKQKVAFITCVNDETEYEECCYYLDRLLIPEGFEKDFIAVRDADSMAAGYQAAMISSDAKYKVYLHQDVFMWKKDCILEMINIFEKHPEIGIMGLVGVKANLRNESILVQYDTGKAFHNLIPNYLDYDDENGNKKECAEIQSYVNALDGMVLMTQYDVNWREDLFDGWDFYDVSQCMEFRKAGYQAAVPVQELPWVFHDCNASKFGKYVEYQHVFMQEYFPVLLDENIRDEKRDGAKQESLVAEFEEKMDNARKLLEQYVSWGKHEELHKFFADEMHRGYARLKKLELISDIDLKERASGGIISVWTDECGDYETVWARLRLLKFAVRRIGFRADESGAARAVLQEFSDIAIEGMKEACTGEIEKCLDAQQSAEGENSSIVTILLLAMNELPFVQLSLDSIRRFGMDLNISVILVENMQVEGLREWAGEQADISYAYMDDGVKAWGDCINQVLDAFQVEGKILFLQSGFLLTPNCLREMLSCFEGMQEIGAVGPVLNRSVSEHQLPDNPVSDYQMACEYGMNLVNERPRFVLGVDEGIFLTDMDILCKVGGMDSDIYTMQVLVKDLSLKLIVNNYRSIICRNALSFSLGKFSGKLGVIWQYASDLETLENVHGMHYFNMQGNMQLLTMLDRGRDDEFSVMEVGCDCGATLNDVKIFFPNSKTIGCDINASVVEVARHFADRAFVSNIEEEKLDLATESLDYVVFGDVLEHLHDPLKTLKYVSCFLKEDGCIIASIPNVMHVSVMKQLLHGNFTYTETGLLDNTHIHLFTYREIERMFEKAGYDMETIEVAYASDEKDPLIDKLLALDSAAERFMYEAVQYKLRARKKGDIYI